MPAASAAAPDRRALLREGAWTLLGVLAREALPPDRVLVLHRLGVGHVLGLAPRAEDGLRRERHALGELRRETLLTPLHQRIRDVRQGPDGLLYVITDEDDGALLRLEPEP